MTFNEKGLCRAMKSAYKGYGYSVARSHSGLVISCHAWGVAIRSQLVPNAVLSLIVLHAGKLPEAGEAIMLRKDCEHTEIYDLAVERFGRLKKAYEEGKMERVYPTRLTMDGFPLWQQGCGMCLLRLDPEYEMIIDYGDMEAFLVDKAVYHENAAGAVWVEQTPMREADSIKIAHLEQMQWTPEELAMTCDDLVAVVPVDQDSHFRLLDCGCGGDVAYVQKADGSWAVRCFGCGRESGGADCRHGAQKLWNGGQPNG